MYIKKINIGFNWIQNKKYRDIEIEKYLWFEFLCNRAEYNPGRCSKKVVADN